MNGYLENFRTDGHTDGRTHGQTHRQTDKSETIGPSRFIGDQKIIKTKVYLQFFSFGKFAIVNLYSRKLVHLKYFHADIVKSRLNVYFHHELRKSII